jgi:hypothetical protein
MKKLALIGDKYYYVTASSLLNNLYFAPELPLKRFYTGNKSYVTDEAFQRLAPDRIREYALENPVGERIQVFGYELDPEKNLTKERLSMDSAESLFFEITKWCNLSCAWCGVDCQESVLSTKSIESVIKNAKYMTDNFLDAMLPYTTEQPILKQRTVFITGGEPLLRQDELIRCYSKIHEMHSAANILMLTNAFFIPLDTHEKHNLFAKMPDVNLELSVTQSLLGQYAGLSHLIDENGALDKTYLGTRGDVSDFISIGSDNAYLEKLSHVMSYCLTQGIPVRLKILDPSEKTLEKVRRNGYEHLETKFEKRVKDFLAEKLGIDALEKIVSYILQLYNFHDKRSVLNSSLNYEPCSKGKELYISADGRLYPGCAQRMLKEFELPYIGFIESQD